MSEVIEHRRLPETVSYVLGAGNPAIGPGSGQEPPVPAWEASYLEALVFPNDGGLPFQGSAQERFVKKQFGFYDMKNDVLDPGEPMRGKRKGQKRVGKAPAFTSLLGMMDQRTGPLISLYPCGRSYGIPMLISTYWNSTNGAIWHALR